MKVTSHKKNEKKAIASKIGNTKACEQIVADVRKGVVMMHGRGAQEADTLVNISGASKQL